VWSGTVARGPVTEDAEMAVESLDVLAATTRRDGPIGSRRALVAWDQMGRGHRAMAALAMGPGFEGAHSVGPPGTGTGDRVV
jgi:hypothetical protein